MKFLGVELSELACFKRQLCAYSLGSTCLSAKG
jgi:hypothetical protein